MHDNISKSLRNARRPGIARKLELDHQMLFPQGIQVYDRQNVISKLKIKRKRNHFKQISVRKKKNRKTKNKQIYTDALSGRVRKLSENVQNYAT